MSRQVEKDIPALAGAAKETPLECQRVSGRRQGQANRVPIAAFGGPDFTDYPGRRLARMMDRSNDAADADGTLTIPRCVAACIQQTGSVACRSGALGKRAMHDWTSRMQTPSEEEP